MPLLQSRCFSDKYHLTAARNCHIFVAKVSDIILRSRVHFTCCCRVQGVGVGWVQGTVVAIENPTAHLYGLQYHPEVQHSERGIATLRRFLFQISKVPADWKIENVLEEEMAKIRATVRP